MSFGLTQGIDYDKSKNFSTVLREQQEEPYEKIDGKLNTVVPVDTVFDIFSLIGFWLKISKLGWLLRLMADFDMRLAAQERGSGGREDLLGEACEKIRRGKNTPLPGMMGG
ncbi:hypothetical protein JWJ90_17335 [Desulfobulbus rhabdoformis]|jgi:hypothetical protein|uniref:hypothetical protein n=1 Tax=Desulfobulbus rhabdoformis TaxID=34032 RepID=UPI001964F87D|nr:hypothetical protein [Desulfobulbus rhabdoformis]MBM9616035.1 hypothetical protein [Desulfobulbus rhabdoformis]